MKKSHGKRIAKMKKLQVTDGFCTRLVTVEDLIQHLFISRSHAHKLVNGDYPLKPAQHDLLCLKLLGTVSDWPGWHTDNGKLYSPAGRYFTATELEHYEYSLNIMALYEVDIKRLLNMVQRLERQLETAQHRELRVYVNDEHEPRVTRPIFNKRSAG